MVNDERLFVDNFIVPFFMFRLDLGFRLHAHLYVSGRDTMRQFLRIYNVKSMIDARQQKFSVRIIGWQISFPCVKN